MGKSTISMAIFNSYVSLSGRFFRWPAVCWPPCAWSAAEARNRALKLWGITSSSFRCARGTGASWKHRGPRCQSFCRSLVFFFWVKVGPMLDFGQAQNPMVHHDLLGGCGFKCLTDCLYLQYLNISISLKHVWDDHHSNCCREKWENFLPGMWTRSTGSWNETILGRHFRSFKFSMIPCWMKQSWGRAKGPAPGIPGAVRKRRRKICKLRCGLWNNLIVSAKHR